MEILRKKVESQVQFWSLLGPFILLLSIAVLLFKVSEHWYLPLSALIGIPLCVKWKMKGMAAALSALFILSFVAYQDLDLDERYWHVGMALTIAFSFIILTLSLEEVQSLIGKLQLESQSRLDNFLRLDEQWKAAEHAWLSEKEIFISQTQSNLQELSKAQEDRQTFYKLAQLSKDELMQIREQHDSLLQELFYKKQQMVQLQERMDETDLTVQEFVNSDPEKMIRKLTEALSCAEQEREAFKAKMFVLQSEYEALKQEEERARNEFKESLDREKLLWESQKKCLQDKQSLQSALHELEGQCARLEEEKNALQVVHSTFKTQTEKEVFDREQFYEQEMELLTNRCRCAQDELSESRALADANQKAFSQAQEKVEQLMNELSAKRMIESDGTEKQRALEQMNEQLEQALQAAQGELGAAQKLLESANRYQEKLPYADGNTRRIESMYVQLKEQFQEKSAVLDDVRRELFLAQEELLKKEREQEEESFWDLSESEQAYQRDLLTLGKQFDQMKQLYQMEVDDLTRLVGALLRQIGK